MEKVDELKHQWYAAELKEKLLHLAVWISGDNSLMSNEDAVDVLEDVVADIDAGCLAYVTKK